MTTNTGSPSFLLVPNSYHHDFHPFDPHAHIRFSTNCWPDVTEKRRSSREEADILVDNLEDRDDDPDICDDGIGDYDHPDKDDDDDYL